MSCNDPVQVSVSGGQTSVPVQPTTVVQGPQDLSNLDLSTLNLGSLDLSTLNLAGLDLSQFDLTPLQTPVAQELGGYELTGGFADRTTGATGASDLGTDVQYTSQMVADRTWLRFGFATAQHLANDKPYWEHSTDENEAPGRISGTGGVGVPTGWTYDAASGLAIPDSYQNVGLFSGQYMPTDVNSMFNFTDNTAYNQERTTGNLKYTAATGSYNFSELRVGDYCQIRFSFNLTPQVPNTTVEVGLIWQTRDQAGNETFTFILAGEPISFGQNTVNTTYLMRPTITAYMASAEDVNARALPAIRADNLLLVQPLATLFNVSR